MASSSQPDGATAASPIRLSTMGMFIIDTFQFIDPTSGRDLGCKGLDDQIGGGGCYFAIGARVWLPPSDLQMIIDRGCDWRAEDQAVLDRFNRTPSPSTSSMWHYRSRPDRTTRAVNIYTGDHRGFDYLSPKIRLEPSDLLQCSPVHPARLPEWIHLICSPERALETIAQIDAVLSEDVEARFPKLVYEPIPDSCVVENLPDCLKVLPRLAVFSPNHEEAASLLGLQAEWERILSSQASTEVTIHFITDKLAGGFVNLLKEQRAQSGAEEGFGPIICIRSGAWGSVVGRAGLGFHHIPAWHTTQSQEPTNGSVTIDRSAARIKDVTGAGNSFLGGFSAYLVQTEKDVSMDLTERMKEAAMRGAVSASLIIEQLGLPSFEVAEGKELWNGHLAAERLDMLHARVFSS